jgi:hypothetical protein
MGFDNNDPKPIVDTAKKTTKVNISMGAAVVVFFVIGAALIVWMRYFHT